MDDQELYRTASRRADAKIGFYIHLTVYVLVNLLLISINLIYEATQNAPPLAVGMNESESESNFENDAKRLRLKAPLLAAGIFTAESVPSPRARHQCVTEIVNRRLPSEPERPGVLQPARAGCCDS